MRVTALLLLLVVAPCSFAFDTVVVGSDAGCGGVTTPPEQSYAEWVGTDQWPHFLEAVAPAPEGRLYALQADRQGFRVVDYFGAGPLTAPISGHPAGLVVGRTGIIYVLRLSGTSQLLAFNRDGSPRATFNLGANFGVSGTLMDLAADQCTLFLLRNGVIRRFNVCTGAFLADFATVQTPPVHAIRVLPDGGVIVATGPRVAPGSGTFRLERYSAGAFVTSYATYGLTRALMLTGDGSRLLYGENACTPMGRLVTLNLTTGTIESMVNLNFVAVPHTIVSSQSWTAAIGHTQASPIPTTDTVALIVIAMLIAAASVFRLR